MLIMAMSQSLMLMRISIIKRLLIVKSIKISYEPDSKFRITLYSKVLLGSSHLIGHTLGFHPQTQKLEPPCTA